VKCRYCGGRLSVPAAKSGGNQRSQAPA
jgi:hypothetical protein